jgi:type VI secretion system protein ImpA
LIKEDRKVARELEKRIDQGDPTANQAPDWRPLIERATKVLREQSKDLEVTAYLIEGLVRVAGFAGMRDGYRLASELVERFWDQGLYPAATDSDIESRFAHMLNLNGLDSAGALIVPIAKIPITDFVQAGQFSRVHHQEAMALSKLPEKQRQPKIEAGAPTIEMIQKAVAETSSEFYVELLEDIEQALQEFKRFGEVMKEKSGYDAPEANIKEALESSLTLIKDLTRSKPMPKGQPTATVEAAVETASSDGEKPMTNGQIVSRDAALEQLLAIAAFFRKSEPQSFIPYALEQVVHLGRLPLPELLGELIAEEGTRKNVFKQVGIPPPSKPS